MKNLNLKFTLAVIAGAVLIMADALYNRYPLLYSDSGTYMSTCFIMAAPHDRPATYGIFLYLFSSAGISLWPVIFFQSLILSYTLILFVRIFTGEKRFISYGLIVIFFLSLFTGMSWTASQVLPDIFTSIGFLALFNLFWGNNDKPTTIILYIIFIVSVLMHLSHVVLFASILAFIILTKKWLLPNKKTFPLLILLAVVLCSELPMRPALDHSKYSIFTGSLIEKGIVQKYLHEYCGQENYKLCKYKDSLDTYNCSTFLWDYSSPFYKIGGWNQDVENDFSHLIYAILSKPKYVWLTTKASLNATAEQLNRFGIFDATCPYTDINGPVYANIPMFFSPEELPRYLNSRQNKWDFPYFDFMKAFYKYTEYVYAILFLALLITYRKVLSKSFKAATVFVLLAILINDWDLCTFGCIADRYGCKVVWLIPLLLSILIINVITLKRGAAQRA